MVPQHVSSSLLEERDMRKRCTVHLSKSCFLSSLKLDTCIKTHSIICNTALSRTVVLTPMGKARVAGSGS